MMTIFAALVGVVVLGVVSTDLFRTTVSAQGQGTVSGWLAEGLWKLLVPLQRKAGSDRLRRATGPLILLLTGAFWIFGIWFGWTLIFYGTQVVKLPGGGDAGLGMSLAYVGSALSTAGNSTMTAAGLRGELLTVFAAVSGMLVLTLTVSFLLNLIGTIMAGRAFALRVASADGMHHLDRASAFSDFAQLCTQLHVYPLALYFAPPRTDLSLADAISRFEDFVRADDECQDFEREMLDRTLGILPNTGTETGERPDDEAFERWTEHYGKPAEG